MSDIPTWHERAMAHPDHQSGMISEDMIRARMAEEIEDLRAEIERLKRERDEARDESKPVQEPVAWRNKKWGYFTVNPIASKHPDWEPLYTAQRTRQLRKTLEGKP